MSVDRNGRPVRPITINISKQVVIAKSRQLKATWTMETPWVIVCDQDPAQIRELNKLIEAEIKKNGTREL